MIVRKIARSPLALISGGYLVLLAVGAVFAGWLAPYDPTESDFGSSLLGPSWTHPLGTDRLGRDTLSRVIFGSRVAMIAATEATLIGVAIGVPLGLLIGYRAGWLDKVAMRIVDGVSSIPGIVLAIAIIAALGTGLTSSMAAVGFVFATVMIRLTRGLVLRERERLYVDGARVMGVSTAGLMFRHVLPNIAPPLIVQTTLFFSIGITIEAGLSFVGLGVQPPAASWGIMLSDAQRSIALDAFQAVPPGVAIFVAVLAVNIFGDAIQRMVVSGDEVGAGTVLDAGRVIRRTASAHAAADVAGALLAVDGLSVAYGSRSGTSAVAVDRASLHVGRGEVVAIVGESGCGKSSLGLGIAGLLAPPAELTARAMRLDDATIDVLAADGVISRAWRDRIGVIFQEPAASLNPVHTIGHQLTRAVRSRGSGKAVARARALELLAKVHIQNPDRVFDSYPHQISGGMAQRVMIALALAQDPVLLIADEPTTALDVTVQAEILTLIRSLCDEFELGVLLITHDIGVVAELADRAVVMYAGQIVEQGTTVDVVAHPLHPYTAALASAVPRNEAGAGIPEALPGSVPDPGAWPEGCRFAGRCAHAIDACATAQIHIADDGVHRAACIRADDLRLIGIAADEVPG